MTVGELIEELQKFSPYHTVVLNTFEKDATDDGILSSWSCIEDVKSGSGFCKIGVAVEIIGNQP